MNRFGRNTPAPAAHLRPTQLPAQWMKSPFIPLQSSIQSVLLSPKGNPVNTKDRSCFCLPKGFLFLLTLSSPLPFSHSFSPDTVRSVRSGCFSPRYSAIPPSGYSSLSQPFPSPGFISQRERERERGANQWRCAKYSAANLQVSNWLPQGPLCAPPRSRRDLSWRTYL